MAKLHTEVLIKEFPQLDIVMPSSIDWVSLGSIILTGLVVVGSTIYTLHNFNKTIRLQENLAEGRNRLEQERSQREMISHSRKEWINSLRDNVSKYIAVIQMIDNHAKISEAKLEAFKDLDKSSEIHAILGVYESLDRYSSEAWSLKTRIKLHLNPQEKLSETLTQELTDIYYIAQEKDIPEEGNGKYWDKLDNIEKITQKILKTEWERVKKLK